MLWCLLTVRSTVVAPEGRQVGIGSLKNFLLCHPPYPKNKGGGTFCCIKGSKGSVLRTCSPLLNFNAEAAIVSQHQNALPLFVETQQ